MNSRCSSLLDRRREIGDASGDRTPPGEDATEPTILHQDTDTVAVDKPAGLAVIPERYDVDAPCLVAWMKQRFGQVWVVHRIDKDTSGVVLFALNADAHRELNRQFETHEVAKAYHALVLGAPAWNDIILDQPLKTDADRRHRTRVDAQSGKPAVTRVRVLERYAGHALVEARPETGRTHQIRAHLRSAGHVIVLDELYKAGLQPKPDWTLPGQAAPLLPRMALHARAITFTHPASKNTITVEAEWPDDFRRAMLALKNNLEQ